MQKTLSLRLANTQKSLCAISEIKQRAICSKQIKQLQFTALNLTALQLHTYGTCFFVFDSQLLSKQTNYLKKTVACLLAADIRNYANGMDGSRRIIWMITNDYDDDDDDDHDDNGNNVKRKANI